MSTAPPPGGDPSGYPAPGSAPSPPPGSAAPPSPGPAPWFPPLPTHKPGVVALRPLRLGDLFDGAFTTIRRNPGAMVGLAAATTALAMVVPAVVALVLAATGDLSGTDGDGFGVATLVGYLGTAVSGLVTVVLTGLLVRVVSGAVLGERTSAGQAWRTTRGRVLGLLGLALVSIVLALVLVGVPVAAGVLVGFTAGVAPGLLVGLPLTVLGVVALVYVYIRYVLLAAPALVLEGTGVRASLRRAGVLGRGQFWRLLGILLLTGILTGVVGQVVGVPLGLLGVGAVALLPGTSGALVLVFTQLLSQVLVAALTTPFTAAVTALLYVDQRIRKEGLDVTLIAASQSARQPVGPR